MEIWTNGSIAPDEALRQAATQLRNELALFTDFSGTMPLTLTSSDEDSFEPVELPANVRNMRIEELDFSVRTYNCLKKASILTISDLVNYTETELMQIRNFGRKSLAEVREKLNIHQLTLRGGATIDLSGEESESDQEND